MRKRIKFILAIIIAIISYMVFQKNFETVSQQQDINSQEELLILQEE